MTIGLTDLLRRTRPFVLIALPLAALAACTDEEIATNVALLKGDPTPEQVAAAKLALTESQFSSASSQVAANLSSSSIEPVKTVAVVELSSSSSEYVAPTPPPPCDPIVWRGTIYDCTMMHILGYVE